jgi:magnesium chelatase subunit I
MIELLDEYIPFVTGSEINDDPFQFQDLQRYYYAQEDNAISWLHRSDRFFEN